MDVKKAKKAKSVRRVKPKPAAKPRVRPANQVTKRDLDFLKREVEKLKKKSKKANLSSYNRFMQKQIKKGLSFKQAARRWSKNKRELARKLKKRTAYNVFVSMQLKQGKTMKQAVRVWNKLKKPDVKKKESAKKKQRPVVKKKKKRLAKKRRVGGEHIAPVKIAKPVPVARQVFPEEKVLKLVNLAVNRARAGEGLKIDVLKNAVAARTPTEMSCGEEIALRMIDVYFTEVARHGIKRTLSLDEVLNSYFYSLIRVKRKSVELKEVQDIMSKERV